jgi:uncharacterized membrane protein HdeD (DUF308 family)
MIPQEVFKRRRNHNNTPEVILLIITNFIVTSLAITIFTGKDSINWFFWIVEGILAYYNYYTIRRNREEFENNGTLISYIISLALLIVVFFLFKGVY